MNCVHNTSYRSLQIFLVHRPELSPYGVHVSIDKRKAVINQRCAIVMNSPSSRGEKLEYKSYGEHAMLQTGATQAPEMVSLCC